MIWAGCFSGGMPRRKLDDSITDFSVQDTDHAVIAGALNYRFPTFDAFMTGMTPPEFEAFESFTLKQTSGPKIVDYVLNKMPQYLAIKEMYLGGEIVMYLGGKMVMYLGGEIWGCT